MMDHLPSREADRLCALHESCILDTAPSHAFDAVVDIARRVAGVPIALVSLIDADRQWFKAKRGLDMDATPRSVSFCAHAILGDDPLLIEDALLDPRFADNPLVVRAPSIRFYAGFPLIQRPGVAYGSLCVIDRRPRRLNEEQIANLEDLARLTVTLIHEHKQRVEAERIDGVLREQALELRLRQRRFEQTERLARVGGWAFDFADGRQEWSDEAYRILGLRRERGADWRTFVSLFDHGVRARVLDNRERAAATGAGVDVVDRITTPDGVEKWVHIVGDVEIVDGAPRRMFGIIQDVSERHNAEALLKRAAFTDLMTNLPNRARFNELVTRPFASNGPPAGLLLIDLDRLKIVNDTLGHAFGDLLITTVASRIAAAVHGAGVACRLGGDEFAVLIDGCRTAEHLHEIASALLAAVEAPIEQDGETISPRVTIGGALSGRHGGNAETLVQNADFALYRAKDHNRGGYMLFEEVFRQSITRRVAKIREVDAALAERRIIPYYQPIVRLDTSEMVGLEALARMALGDGRVVAAGSFQEALTDAKVSHKLTSLMVERVAEDIGGWLARGTAFHYVGLNVGMADFQRGDLEHRIETAFARCGVRMEHAVLEVTETVFMGGSDDAVAKAIGRLRDKGLLVALDDFGTGHASLTHLREFPVDIIKIDKSFVDCLLTDRSSQAIVEALIGLSRKLNMRIIAEGVETIEQADALRAMGCEYGQGYLFARPASAVMTTQLAELFSRRAVWTGTKAVGSSFAV